MTVAQKFLFDRIFDPANPLSGSGIDSRTDDQTGAEPAAEAEVQPSFTETDLAEAREAGFSAGREEGRKEGLQGQEKRVADTLGAIAERLNDLLRVEEEHHVATERQTLAVMAAAARKVLPDLSERGALGEIEHLTRDLLERLRHDSRVTIRVHPDLVDALNPRLEGVTSGLAATSELSVMADAHIARGDCRLEWGDGGGERRVEALLDEMDAIIRRNLDGLESASTPPDTPAAVKDEAAVTMGPDETPDSSVSELQRAQEAIAQLAEPSTSQTDDTGSHRSEREAAETPENGVETVPASPPSGDPA